MIEEQFIIVAEDLSGPVVMTEDGDFIPLEDVTEDTELRIYTDYTEAERELNELESDMADDVYMSFCIEDFTGELEYAKL